MHSNSYERSIDATEAAEKILGFYPKVAASDPQVFITGLVELLRTYPPFVIARVASPVNGVPTKYKFCPTIQEIKETCDEWVDRQRQHDRIVNSYTALPGPERSRVKGHATTAALCERFGVRAIPSGWDAITVTQQAHIHGSDFPNVVEKLLKTPQAKLPPSLPQQIANQAREAMQRRLGEAAE